MYAKILEINSASYFMYKTNPAILVISAQGTVPTSGWTDGQLSPYIYVTPPKDGIQDFDFIAKPPTGIVLQVLTPIEADWRATMPKWLKGFRIHASSGSKTWKFGEQKPVEESLVIRGGEVPWPVYAAE